MKRILIIPLLIMVLLVVVFAKSPLKAPKGLIVNDKTVFDTLGFFHSNAVGDSSIDSSAIKTAVSEKVIIYLYASDDEILSWAQSEAYEPDTTYFDSNNIVDSMTVVWPDSSTGTFITTTKNTTWFAVDAYTISHSGTSQTVTQTAVTRNTDGDVIKKPVLSIN